MGHSYLCVHGFSLITDIAQAASAAWAVFIFSGFAARRAGISCFFRHPLSIKRRQLTFIPHLDDRVKARIVIAVRSPAEEPPVPLLRICLTKFHGNCAFIRFTFYTCMSIKLLCSLRRQHHHLPRRPEDPGSRLLRRPYRGLLRPGRPGTSVRTAAERHSSVFPCRS